MSNAKKDTQKTHKNYIVIKNKYNAPVQINLMKIKKQLAKQQRIPTRYALKLEALKQKTQTYTHQSYCNSIK